MIRNIKKSLGIFLAFSLFAGSTYGAAWQFGGLRLDALKITSSGSATPLTKSDKQVIVLTGSATGVMKLPNATTLQSGYFYSFSNESTGSLVVSNSSSTALVTLTTGQSATLVVTSNSTSGGPWTVFKGAGAASVTAPNCSIFLTGGNGYGSVGTKIRRFTTTVTSCTDGAATYLDDSSNGATFTVATGGAGNYCFGRKDRSGSANYVGWSKNANSLTTSLDSLTVANGRLGGHEAGSSVPDLMMFWCIRLADGDIIRPHDRGSLGGTGDTDVFMYFVKVGN